MPLNKGNLKAALTYLDGFQFHGFRLGLERMTRILNAFGSPEKNYPCLHVAGTNGKGSVSAIIASILHAAEYKTGLYTSPHLSSLRERFKIGNTLISEEELKEQMSILSGGLDKLHDASVLVTSMRHYEALRNALDALQNARELIDAGAETELVAFELRSALDYVGEITGRVVNEEVLNVIFDRFCIGK